MSQPMRYLDMLIPQEPQAQDSWTWATVTQQIPLKIRLDGEVAALAGTPETMVQGLEVGNRVWVQLYGRRAIIHGSTSSDTGGGSSVVGIDSGWHYLDYAKEPRLSVARYLDVSGSWSPGQYRRDASGTVYLAGLIGTAAAGTILFTLPVGFRPAYRCMFQCCGSNAQILIEVNSNGAVRTASPSGNDFLSLENIQFKADLDDPVLTAAWTPLTLENGWVTLNVNDAGPPAYMIDTMGDVFFRGIIAGGGANVNIASLPAPIRPYRQHLWTIPANGGLMRTNLMAGGQLQSEGFSPGATNSWVALNGMIASNVGEPGLWPVKPPKTNGWVPYQSAENQFQDLRFAINANGVVTMWGLIGGGTANVEVVPVNGIYPAYCPDNNHIFAVAAANVGACRVDVGSNGSILLRNYWQGGVNSWVGLHARWFMRGR